MKKIAYAILSLVSLGALFSCGDSDDAPLYSDEYYVEECLVGGSWHWTKTIYYDDVPSNSFSYVEYAHDDLSYFFEPGGHVSIRSTFESRYGCSYADWIDGRWSLYNGDLRIDTYNGSWSYIIQAVDDWSLVLVYYDEYYDDWGNIIPRRVEEYYER